MTENAVPISSVKHSYDLVHEIRDRGQAGVTELATALDRPKSTIHNHLQTLEELGYVVKTDGLYRLSSRYFHIGWESRANYDAFAYGYETVKRLESETNRHVQLVVEEDGMGTILYATRWQAEDQTPIEERLSLTRAELHTNAPGKAILAHLPTEDVTSIVERHGLSERTKRTITDEQTLRDELDAIRDRGYAIDRGEMIDGSAGVGVAITTDQSVFGAIAVYGPANEILEEIESNDLPALVREYAETIRANIVFGSLE